MRKMTLPKKPKAKPKMPSTIKWDKKEKVIPSKRKNETLSGMISRQGKKILALNQRGLIAFVKEQFPMLTIETSGTKEVINPYSHRKNVLNPVQYALYHYIVNYELYTTIEHKLAVLEAQLTMQTAKTISDMLKAQEDHFYLLQNWNGARMLFQLLWSEIYYNQID